MPSVIIIACLLISLHGGYNCDHLLLTDEETETQSFSSLSDVTELGLELTQYDCVIPSP